ncbi:hypothetical protein T8T21_01550 [Limimaricola variabilis]|uniref:hypothetical protein n=1 Tax=Limimaricola variabilis TaxID=1492771 RepID=UPI002AC9040F|nr:hypothetical protein [Limimaricola variabilis]WPY94837.1 hypothetical protein T8T21_01550 [Limimaricola variabilis]
MKSVSPELFDLPSWAWILLPIVVLLLASLMDRNGRMRGSGLGLIATSLVIFGAVALTRWSHFV